MVNLQFKILVIQLAIFNFGKSRYSIILEILSISVFNMGGQLRVKMGVATNRMVLFLLYEGTW